MFKVSLLAIMITASSLSFGQAISREYQKACQQEQLNQHQGIKGKAVSEEDFATYCNCQAEFVSKNANNQQINDLLMNPKAKPDWLKNLETKAIKVCLSPNAKMNI